MHNAHCGLTHSTEYCFLRRASNVCHMMWQGPGGILLIEWNKGLFAGSALYIGANKMKHSKPIEILAKVHFFYNHMNVIEQKHYCFFAVLWKNFDTYFKNSLIKNNCKYKNAWTPKIPLQLKKYVYINNFLFFKKPMQISHL